MAKLRPFISAAACVAVVCGLALGHPIPPQSPPHHHDDDHHHHDPGPGLYPLSSSIVNEMGQVPVHGVPAYQNLTSTGFRYSLGATMIADDLHMISGGDMVAFSFMFAGTQAFCAGFWSGVATVRFYSNNADNTLLPSAGTLIASYDVIINSVGVGNHLIHYDLPTPVAVPQDLWMGISFSGGVIGGSGVVTGAATPTIGSSQNAHFTGQHGYVVSPHGAFVHANYVLAVFIPAPGAATGLLAGLLMAGRRRRRPE